MIKITKNVTYIFIKTRKITFIAILWLLQQITNFQLKTINIIRTQFKDINCLRYVNN